VIALDSNIFIYVLEGHRDFGRPAAAVLRQAQNSGSASMFVYLELLSAPVFRDPKVRNLAQSFLDNQNLIFIELDKNMLIEAAALRARLTPKIGVGDAIHIASAIRAGADEFVTNDNNLLKVKLSHLKLTKL